MYKRYESLYPLRRNSIFLRRNITRRKTEYVIQEGIIINSNFDSVIRLFYATAKPIFLVVRLISVAQSDSRHATAGSSQTVCKNRRISDRSWRVSSRNVLFHGFEKSLIKLHNMTRDAMTPHRSSPIRDTRCHFRIIPRKMRTRC